MSKGTDLVELQKTLALLPGNQLKDVKRCVYELSELLLSYDETVALLAISTIGLALQAEIESGNE